MDIGGDREDNKLAGHARAQLSLRRLSSVLGGQDDFLLLVHY